MARSWRAAERGWASANAAVSSAMRRARRSRSRVGRSVTPSGWRAATARCAVIPRGGSVDVADEAADVAGRRAGLGIEIEQAGAAVGAAEEAAVRGRGECAATHPPNGGGASGDGRCGGTGHHVCWYLCFLARLDRGMSDRLRRSDLMSLRAGPGAWFGRSNRVVASDGYSGSIGHPFDFVKWPMVRGR